MIELRRGQGLYLPSCDLWLDPHRPVSAAFVSHAHTDHIGRHRRVLATPETLALMEARMRATWQAQAAPCGAAVERRGARLVLLPAGHVLGSAQLLAETDGGSLLYTGDFKLRPGLSCEPARPARADVLVMETTFGKPRYRFPPSEETVAAMVRFCRETVAGGETAVLFAYSLGKAQEALYGLGAAGIVPLLHESVLRMTRVYARFRDDVPAHEPWRKGALDGRVLICPPAAARGTWLAEAPRRRTMALTGWALDPGAKYRYGCDEVLPLSDHADYDELLSFVEQVAPRRVYTVHGFAQEFAADLRRRGLEAWALGKTNQLEWNLD